MNKVIVVGHPLSGYGDVIQLLFDCGMSSALPSRQEGLTPQEIDCMLCKAHGISPLNVGSLENHAYDQIEIGAVWNGMVLDLMRGNLEQQFWGWADPQAIYLLNYWKTIDPKIAFILVYNHPRTALIKDTVESDSGSTPQEGIDLVSWKAYNDALLHFYQRNAERCLLVHVEQVRASVNSYLQQLRTRIDAPIGKIQDSSLLRGKTELSEKKEPKDVSEASANSQNQTDLVAFTGTSDPLEIFLADELIQQFPEALELYEELQAIATLPYSRSFSPQNSAFLAWQNFSRLQRESLQFAEQTQVLKSALDKLQHDKDKALHLQNATQQENELLLIQLHKIQDDFERSFLKAQDDLKKIQKLELIEKKSAEQFLELKQKNNELEQYALKNQDYLKKIQELDQVKKKFAEQSIELKKKENELVKYSLKDQDFLKKVQELEQIKKKLIEQSIELKQQKEIQNELKEKLQKKEQEFNKIRAKQIDSLHEIQQENNLLLLQLHQVQEKLEWSFLENAELKKNQQPIYYGAAERVKGELSYKIGAAIIERSRKGWPLLFLPFSMWSLARDYRKTPPQQDKNQPPLPEYRDYPKAQKAMQHLSYRLGKTWLKHCRTPWGFLIMPFALLKTDREFQQYKKQ